MLRSAFRDRKQSENTGRVIQEEYVPPARKLPTITRLTFLEKKPEFRFDRNWLTSYHYQSILNARNVRPAPHRESPRRRRSGVPPTGGKAPGLRLPAGLQVRRHGRRCGRYHTGSI